MTAASPQRYSLRARVSSRRPAAVGRVIREQVPDGLAGPSRDPNEWLVKGELEGTSARDLNRTLLSAPRRVEMRNRLRAEWTRAGVTERYFDYVPKGKRPISPPAVPPP